MNKESTIEKIKKMLALAANDPESEESKTAARMAGELMAKYQIEMFEIEEEQAEAKVVKEEFETTIKSDELWQGQLAVILSEVFDCFVLRVRVGQTDYVWRFFGHESDIALISWYFKFLRIKIGKMGSDRFKKKREKMDYCLGLVVGVREVLDIMFRSQQRNLNQETKDLVLLKRENVERQVREIHPNIRKGKSRAKTDMSLVSQGITDGKKISLHKPVSGNTSNSTSVALK